MGRYEDLTAKRDSQGLTHEEANELGELIAKREGKPYGNAQNAPPAVEAERDVDDSVLTEEGAPGREVDNPSLG